MSDSETTKETVKEKLTDRQNLFCRLRANGQTCIDAYKAAYNSNAKSQIISQKASALMANPKIKERIAKLQGISKQDYLWTRQMAVMHLINIVENEVAAFALGAIKELNMMHGFDKPIPTPENGDELPMSITVTINDARKKKIKPDDEAIPETNVTEEA